VEESVQLRLAFRWKVMVYKRTPPTKNLGQEYRCKLQGIKTMDVLALIAVARRAKTHARSAKKHTRTLVARSLHVNHVARKTMYVRGMTNSGNGARGRTWMEMKMKKKNYKRC
jgi:hypothetical protein